MDPIVVKLSDGMTVIAIGHTEVEPIQRTMLITTRDDGVHTVNSLSSLSNQDCVDLAAALISHIPGFTIALRPPGTY